MNMDGTDIDAVITSFNQGSMILEAVQSLCSQTTLPQNIIIVDDGSTDGYSLDVLKLIETDPNLSVPVTICFQDNGGVSSARNFGIKQAQTSMILVLDGDDKLEPTYIEHVSNLLRRNPTMVAASSWMHTFGTLTTIVRPTGGNIIPFLSHNCCPATHIFQRAALKRGVGYDESMRSGFEDWDFFLNLLESNSEAHIGIIESPLINYRTTPDSANMKSMDKRLQLMRYIIQKHANTYYNHLADALLDIEAISNSRLYGWENEIIHSNITNQTLSESSANFIRNPSYGDGGLASVIRIVSSHN